MPNPWRNELERDGYAVVTDVLTPSRVEELRTRLSVDSGRGGNRQVTDPEIHRLAWEGEAMDLARSATGPSARPVRILFFDKQPGANWSVPYHQDLTIVVRERADVNGFGPWSVKADLPHVQAPREILERMVAVRLHLDPCGAENGPLRVLPGTHRHGRLRHEDIDRLATEREEATVTAPVGAAILMRPLLLHASSPAASPHHRRVLHIEYAATNLPAPLNWNLAR
jgi:hypothetical protein